LKNTTAAGIEQTERVAKELPSALAQRARSGHILPVEPSPEPRREQPPQRNSAAGASEIGKRSLLYLIGNAISAAFLFALIPLHTRLLPPSEYGRFDLDIGFVYLAISIAFVDINQVVLRFCYLEKGLDDRTRPLYSALPVVAAGIPIYIAAIFFIDRIVPLGYPWLLVPLGFATKWVDIYGAACRGLGRTREFVIGEIVYAVCVVLATILLMIGVGLRLPALYLAAVTGYICQLAYLEYRLGVIRRFSFSRVSLQLTLRMVRYAAPLVLNIISYWFINRFARIVIARELSVAENGLYAVAAGVSLALTMLARNFMRAWQEAAFSLREEGDQRTEYFSRAFEVFVAILGAVFVLLLPLVTLFYPIFSGNDYRAGVAYVAPALLAVLFQSLDLFLAHIHGHVLDNRIVVISTVGGAAVTVLLAAPLVRTAGVNGASLAVCLGFSVAVTIKLAYLRARVGLRARPLPLLMSAAGVAVSGAAHAFGAPIVMIAGVIALIPVAQTLLKARVER
jgi:O-antigen/teichoic acid export membrane protein